MPLDKTTWHIAYVQQQQQKTMTSRFPFCLLVLMKNPHHTFHAVLVFWLLRFASVDSVATKYNVITDTTGQRLLITHTQHGTLKKKPTHEWNEEEREHYKRASHVHTAIDRAEDESFT